MTLDELKALGPRLTELADGMHAPPVAGFTMRMTVDRYTPHTGGKYPR